MMKYFSSKGELVMSKHQVTCINKEDRYNPFERITHIGGINGDRSRWKLTQTDAINSIESGKYEFFVRANGHIVEVIVAKSKYGNKYLKTESDGDTPDNLLSLPEC